MLHLARFRATFQAKRVSRSAISGASSNLLQSTPSSNLQVVFFLPPPTARSDGLCNPREQVDPLLSLPNAHLLVHIWVADVARSTSEHQSSIRERLLGGVARPFTPAVSWARRSSCSAFRTTSRVLIKFPATHAPTDAFKKAPWRRPQHCVWNFLSRRQPFLCRFLDVCAILTEIQQPHRARPEHLHAFCFQQVQLSTFDLGSLHAWSLAPWSVSDVVGHNTKVDYWKLLFDAHSIACNILSARLHSHNDFFQPFVSIAKTACVCVTFTVQILLFPLLILHGCRTSIAGARTLATLGTGSDGTADCASKCRTCVGRSSDQDYTAGPSAPARWTTGAAAGTSGGYSCSRRGQTNGTEETKHEPI